MSRGTILAHKHTLCEAFTGFFRALASERFVVVREWLHPELESLIWKQCERMGETAFLRGLRVKLGSATQRVRLGSSQAEGARQIKTELLGPDGTQAGSVRFVLSTDGWRIYSVEVWSNVGAPPQMRAPVAPTPAVQTAPRTKAKKKSRLPKFFTVFGKK